MGTIGNRIKTLRKKKNWTQQNLAAHVNVSSQVISNWEREYTNPTHEDVSRLAKVLEASADYIIFGEESTSLKPLGDHSNTETANSEIERLILQEVRQLRNEDKQKALDHIKFLRYMAGQDKEG